MLPRARPRTGRRRGVRARLRARQGRPAPDRRGDRGRQRRRVLRRRDRLPHPHRADLAPRDPLRVRRGGRARRRGPGLAAGDARQGDRPGAGQAQGPGRRDRPVPPRGGGARPSPPTSRPSSRSGTPSASAARSASPTSAPPSRSRPPAASSRGAWPAPRVAGTSSASTSTAAPSASSACRGSWARCARRASRRRTTSLPAPTCAAIARRLSPSFPSVRAELRLRQGTGVGLRRRAESVTPLAGPPGWDLVVVEGPVHDLSDEVLTYGADVVVRRPRRRCATTWSPGSAPIAEGAADDRPARRHRPRPGGPAARARALPARPRRGAPRRRRRALRHRRRPDRARPAPAVHDRPLAGAARATSSRSTSRRSRATAIIRVDNADYLARPVRFSPAEATALVVALRTMLEAAPDEARDVIERTLAKLEEAAGQDGEGLLRLHVAPTPLETSAVVPVLESAIAPRPPGRDHLPRALARRGVTPRRRPARAHPGRGPALPRRLVPHRGRRPGLPRRPHPRRHRARHARSPTRARAPATSPAAGSATPRPRRSPCGSRRRRAGSSSTTRSPTSAPAPTAPSTSTSRSPARRGCARCCCAWRPHADRARTGRVRRHVRGPLHARRSASTRTTA